MPDPINDPAKVTEDLKKYEEALVSAGSASGNFQEITNQGAALLIKLSKNLNEASKDIDNIGIMSKAADAAFTALFSGSVKVQESFKGFAGIDSSGISSFKDQLESINSSMTKNNVADTIASLKKVAMTHGATSDQIKATEGKSSKEIINALNGIINAQIGAADATMRAASGQRAQMASTGELTSYYNKTGESLGNLNNTTQDYIDQTIAQGKAGNRTEEQTLKIASTFGLIPGALNSVINATGKASDNMGGLTASLKLADATGLGLSATQDAITHSQKSFTTSTIDAKTHMQDSLVLTAGLSELSNKLHISYDTVSKGIFSASDELMNYTNAGKDAFTMTTGLRNITNEMAGGLMDAGMSGDKAMKTIGSYTKSMEGMTTAQKAFLSAQTGGPGGLQGAAQIENMIRKGDIEGLKKKVEETLKKQFGGKIVTTEDAANDSTGQAAAQYNKQKMLLQQGPLGSMVKSDADAAQFLDMMKGKESGKTSTALSTNVLNDAIGRGSKWEELTAGSTKEIADILNTAQFSIMAGSLTRIQNALETGSTGSSEEERKNDEAAKIREQRRIELANNAKQTGDIAAEARQNENKESTGDNGLGVRTAAAKKAATKVVSIPAALKRAVAAFAGNNDAAGKEEKPPAHAITAKAESSDPQSRKLLAEAARANAAAATADAKPGSTPPRAPNAGAKVADAQRAPTAPSGKPGAAPQLPYSVQVNKDAPRMKIIVDVHVSPEDQQSDHTRSVNPAGQTAGG